MRGPALPLLSRRHRRSAPTPASALSCGLVGDLDLQAAEDRRLVVHRVGDPAPERVPDSTASFHRVARTTRHTADTATGVGAVGIRCDTRSLAAPDDRGDRAVGRYGADGPERRGPPGVVHWPRNTLPSCLAGRPRSSGRRSSVCAMLFGAPSTRWFDLRPRAQSTAEISRAPPMLGVRRHVAFVTSEFPRCYSVLR
jgi:hypothetical protein